MSNLNNSPGAGPLTAAELNKLWPPRRVHADDWPDTIPMPAEAATDIGAHPQRRRTDPGYVGWGALLPAVLVLAAVGVLALARWVLT